MLVKSWLPLLEMEKAPWPTSSHLAEDDWNPDMSSWFCKVHAESLDCTSYCFYHLLKTMLYFSMHAYTICQHAIRRNNLWISHMLLNDPGRFLSALIPHTTKLSCSWVFFVPVLCFIACPTSLSPSTLSPSFLFQKTELVHTSSNLMWALPVCGISTEVG